MECLNLAQEVFLNKLLITVKKKQKIELTKEQGWHSEQELVELGWSKPGSHLLSTALEIYNYEGQRWVLIWACFLAIITDCQGTKSKEPRQSAKPWGRAMPGSGNIYNLYMVRIYIPIYCTAVQILFSPIPKDSTVAHPNSNPGIRQWQETWIRWRRGVLGHDEGDGKENGIYVIWRNASTGEGGHTLNFLSVHFIGTWWILQVYFILQLCNCEKLKYIGEISSDPRQGHRWAQRWLRWPHVCHAGSGQDQGWQSKGHEACTPSAPKQGCAGTWVGKWAILFCTELLHLAFGGFESYVENELNQTLAHHTCSNTFAWQTRDALKKFMESLISKTGKLRSLIRELETKYNDQAATA